MTDYTAPVRDILFVLEDIVDFEALRAAPEFADSTPDVVSAVLEEAGKFAAGVLAPLNTAGDLIGSRVVEGQVRETSGFAEAYQQYVDAGWNTISASPEHGGMGLPEVVGTAALEMWSAANLSFGLCPLLSQGAIQALYSHAEPGLRDQYLGKLIAGQWTGTMNLTEPQAGSDLAVIRTRAVRDGDAYRISGTKIFITWGDHQMAENIIHLVLARTADAPEGVHGISLFIVPKYLPDSGGNPSIRNDVRVQSVEHKMGIHGSPTCVLNFGAEEGGALGYLVGEENRGLSYMFTMMNHARLSVGVQGVALSDRAYQKALAYATERVQGVPAGMVERDVIANHPDVSRMLMLMRSLTEASRALCYLTAASFDLAHHATDPDRASAAQSRGELLTPIAKAWSTEVSQEVTYLGVQVHGGMGFIEETGAAQFMRDARITTIYEGTTAIQANDLMGRKFLRDGGAELKLVIDEMRDTVAQATRIPALADTAGALGTTVEEIAAIVDWLLAEKRDDAVHIAGVAFNFLMACGACMGGWLMLRAATAAQAKLAEDEAFYSARIRSAQFFMVHVLPRATASLSAVRAFDEAAMDTF